ncbi:MAG TPA: pantetheine-phosphate adenylyltransferase [Dehalococcoidia bacterium]|jgi:pantetheine-phosphate adenylyltransferase
MPTAFYAGRFDPIHNGHLDIIRRAAEIFDKVIVGVEQSGNRIRGPQYLFETEERVAFFKDAIADHANVSVLAYTGLTVEFARKHGAGVLIRSMRSNTDFENEFNQAMMNRTMAPDIESVYLLSRLEHQFLSGTLIREVAFLGYDVTGLVPVNVAAALKRKFGGA